MQDIFEAPATPEAVIPLQTSAPDFGLIPTLTPEMLRSRTDEELQAMIDRYGLASGLALQQRTRAISLEDRVAELQALVEWHQRVAEQAGLERAHAIAEKLEVQGRLEQAQADRTKALLLAADRHEMRLTLGVALGLLRQGVASDHPSVRDVELAASRFGIGSDDYGLDGTDPDFRPARTLDPAECGQVIAIDFANKVRVSDPDSQGE